MNLLEMLSLQFLLFPLPAVESFFLPFPAFGPLGSSIKIATVPFYKQARALTVPNANAYLGGKKSLRESGFCPSTCSSYSKRCSPDSSPSPARSAAGGPALSAGAPAAGAAAEDRVCAEGRPAADVEGELGLTAGSWYFTSLSRKLG